jgi:MFS family permease
MENATAKMTLGQFSEALFILAIPFLFNTIGVKKMLLLGITAWLLRYVCFAFGNADSNLWMLYAGIILHGVCYDFFFVTGYMYTEKKAGEKIKNAAQGLFTFATYGLGMFIGTWFSGFTSDFYTIEGVFQWKSIWLIPAIYLRRGTYLLYSILQGKAADRKSSVINTLELYEHRNVRFGIYRQVLCRLPTRLSQQGQGRDNLFPS